jgi:hypothetical protein
MTCLIRVERDLRERPAQFEVSLSDDLREELGGKRDVDAGKLIRFFYAGLKDEHFILIEQPNHSKVKIYLGVAHEVEEVERRLSDEAEKYASQLQRTIRGATGIHAPISKRDYPYEGWREEHSNLVLNLARESSQL